MSLLNQYLKTIGRESHHNSSLEPLPSMLKARQKKSVTEWRGYKASLLILATMVTVTLITWWYSNQRPSGLMASQVTHGEIVLVGEDIQAEDIKKIESAKMTTGHEPASEVSGSQEIRDLHDESSVAASSETDMLISSEESEVPVPEVSEMPSASIPVSSKQPGRLQEAAPPIVETLSKVERVEPSIEVAQSYYQLGLVALQEGKLKDAEHFLLETLNYTPNDINALLNLSSVYIQQERLELAVRTLESIRKIDPENVNKSLNNLGYVALKRKDYKQARFYFEEALAINPFDEPALINLAYVAQAEDNRIEALRCYEKIISINPENGNVLINAAHLFAQEGQIDRAIQLYTRSLTLKSVQNDRGLTNKIKQRISLMIDYE